MIALWGPDLIQIYNDGYRDLLGDTPPAGLGMPARNSRPEFYPSNELVYERVRAGGTLTVTDAH